MKTALKKAIFLVDSNPSWNIAMTQLLSGLGYTNIISFESAAGCVNSLHLNPSFIFLDFQMKVMDGLEVIRRAKEVFPAIGIVFCTANEKVNFPVHDRKKGSCNVLSKKNITGEKIRSVLENFIAEDGLIAS